MRKKLFCLIILIVFKFLSFLTSSERKFFIVIQAYSIEHSWHQRINIQHAHSLPESEVQSESGDVDQPTQEVAANECEQGVQVDGLHDSVFGTVVHSNPVTDMDHREDAAANPALEEDPADVALSSAWCVEDEHAYFACGEEEERVEHELNDQLLLLVMSLDDSFFGLHVLD
jgi:hypothetical protein